MFGGFVRGAGRVAAALIAVIGGVVITAPSASAAPTVVGVVDCYWDNGNGTYTFSVGYVNTSASTVTLPVGAQNYVTPGAADRGQPTVFLTGTHPNAWAPTLSAQEVMAGTNWYVQGAPVQIKGFTQCSSKPVPAFANVAAGGLFVGLLLVTGLALLGRRRHSGAGRAWV